MKRDVATFVSKCLICQQVKIEHQRPGGKMQRIEIPEVEMGRHYDGFHRWIASIQETTRFNLGDRGQTYQVCSLPANQHSILN